MRALSSLLILLAAAATLTPGAAAAFCRTPEQGVADMAGEDRRLLPDGAEICIREAGPDCFGCESGVLHACRGGLWRPLPDLPCGARAQTRARARPRLLVPFRHCRYFDSSGVELTVSPEELRSAQSVGLIAYQRCETVYCRFYDRYGNPVAYAPDEADRIDEDLHNGTLARQSTECRRPDPPTEGFGDR